MWGERPFVFKYNQIAKGNTVYCSIMWDPAKFVRFQLDHHQLSKCRSASNLHFIMYRKLIFNCSSTTANVTSSTSGNLLKIPSKCTLHVLISCHVDSVALSALNLKGMKRAASIGRESAAFHPTTAQTSPSSQVKYQKKENSTHADSYTACV